MTVYTDKFIFYHVPKTGGMWLVRNLPKMVSGVREGGANTKKGKYIPHHLVPDGKPPIFSFCFFRHPLDWYRSIFTYKNTRRNWRVLEEENDYFYKIGVNEDDFNRFIEKLFKVHPEGFCTSLFKEFESVDFIGKYENLMEDLKKALTMAGEDFTFDNLGRPDNVSDKSVVAEYNKKNKKMVEKADKYIIDKYYS